MFKKCLITSFLINDVSSFPDEKILIILLKLHLSRFLNHGCDYFYVDLSNELGLKVLKSISELKRFFPRIYIQCCKHNFNYPERLPRGKYVVHYTNSFFDFVRESKGEVAIIITDITDFPNQEFTNFAKKHSITLVVLNNTNYNVELYAK
ncbi:hypothetical protein HYG86_14055 [Alkalicella caledoniensis]|uniref:Uncharacterized protein n=1 Tax=Alkalicella caledoniensis TaxID=2731377 RepID=A0A7G9WAU5_ALKCA|nr:hypothetical protein [Alkalicella caledoniensis]QNO15807.1 hypothetical protein HYG86_14055 [Alkalicella caledoniensis]